MGDGINWNRENRLFLTVQEKHATHHEGPGEILESHGMKVYVYEGGISEWRDSGYPMEGEKYTEK